jgi:CDP-diacylglycerol--glycerol-3-phosphate 3-phosphatidyltransferase
MTLANRITLTRLALSMAVFFLVIQKTFVSVLAGLIVMIIASVSDYVDGAIARKTGTTTSFGAIADPFADKILVMAAFISFASVKMLDIPLWAIFLILLRELTISTLRVLAALQGEVMRAEASGKFKTTIQLIAGFTIMALLLDRVWVAGHPDSHPFLLAIDGFASPVSWWLTVIASAVTVVSGIMYLSNHRELLRKSWSEKKDV